MAISWPFHTHLVPIIAFSWSFQTYYVAVLQPLRRDIPSTEFHTLEIWYIRQKVFVLQSFQKVSKVI